MEPSSTAMTATVSPSASQDALQRTPSRTSTTSAASTQSHASGTEGETMTTTTTTSTTTTSKGHRQSVGGGTTRRRKQSARAVNSDVEDKHLTSFPSLSPEASPHTPGPRRRGTKPQEEAVATPVTARRTAHRPSKMVDALTRHSPSFHRGGRNALFDESPTTAQSTPGVPGNIHTADDAHIERLIARTGAVALVRQLAEDLAHREMEVITHRRLADARERELKKMLREVEVSNLDIEKRLHSLDHTGIVRAQREEIEDIQRKGGLGELMREAIGDELGSLEGTEDERQATIRASQLPTTGDESSRRSSVGTGEEGGKGKGWKDYLWGAAPGKDGRPQSIASSHSGETKERARAESGAASSRRKVLDDTLFQPPPSGEDGAIAEDGASIGSKRDRRSGSTNWTMGLFGGRPNSQKGDRTSRERALSNQSSKSNMRQPSQNSTPATSSAQAALLKVNDSNAAARKPKRAPAPLVHSQVAAAKHSAQSSQSQPPPSPASVPDATNYGPVEMDAILPAGTRPPTLSPPVQNLDNPMEPLTDRFGFIYDQRRRKKEADAFARMGKGKPRAEVLSTSKDSGDASSFTETLPVRPGSPASVSSNQGWRWQDYLRIATFPTELLAHTPSSTNIITLGNADMQESLKRAGTYDESSVPNAVSTPAPAAAALTPKNAEMSRTGPIPVSATATPPNEPEPVKLLLGQLTELHDALQREREFKWNDFLRKVRAERRREGEALVEAGGTADMPEVALTDGEVVGIATLGHKGKVGRAKYREFRALVLGGIPVAHRAKLWAECSGAAMLRVPGYYVDLARGVDGGGGIRDDPAVTAQIAMDIRRTLTDNVFFRNGPGVTKLQEVLRAYARRNPEVGYCQGMNLIVGSLLLIVPTAEDAFWLLASLVERLLPRRYYDRSLLASRADQVVLRSYVAELLPRLSSHLESLGVELEALTFQWFLSLFTACLSAEALYRVWDVLLCCCADDPDATETRDAGSGSVFLFQVALALLKLNEPALLACATPSEVYAYLGNSITNHAISIDGLIGASDALRGSVRRADVDDRRARAVDAEQKLLKDRERIRREMHARKGSAASAASSTTAATAATATAAAKEPGANANAPAVPAALDGSEPVFVEG